MAVSAQKAKAPITSTIVSPINESVEFTPNNTIIFRIGPSDLLYWLVQDSYFMFDVEWILNDATNIDEKSQDLVIRGSGMFFDNVRILHAGNEVYYSQYNVAQQMLDLLKSGDDYLEANFNEWTTHRTYERAKVLGHSTPLVLTSNELYTAVSDGEIDYTKRGYIIRVGQLLKCFSQCENFPMKYLTQQIEIRLQLAKVQDFVCRVTKDTLNFYDWTGNTCDPELTSSYGAYCPNECLLGYTNSSSSDEDIKAGTFNDYDGLTYKITKMRLYMFGEDVDPGYDNVISAENAGGQGKVWKYTMPHINIRNEPAREAGYMISNFHCITENTNNIYIWCTRGTNWSAMIKPKVINMNLRFGPYMMPKSPTQEDNWSKPAIYKELVDDTFEYSTAYYTSANRDLWKCYYAKPYVNSTVDCWASSDAPEGDTNAGICTLPHDCYILLASSFTTDDGKPGSNSKAWNSQYNLHYNLCTKEGPMNILLVVDSDHVLTLRNGMLSNTNI